MNWIDKIVDFFTNTKKGVKKLPEAKQLPNEYRRNEQWKVQERLPIQPVVYHSQLEKAILDYMDIYFKESYAVKEGGLSSYGILTSMNTKLEPPGENRKIQDWLIENLERNRRFEVLRQKSEREKQDVFYHIRHGDYETGQNKMIRIYVNTHRQNVAALVCEFINRMDKGSYYVKFLADQEMESGNRLEKLVFYINMEQINSVIQTMLQIKKEKPYLLYGSEITNPFIETIEGFMNYASNPTQPYKDMRGRIITEKGSYNKYLSMALEESVREAVIETSLRDIYFAKQIHGNIEDMREYKKFYTDLKKQKEVELLQRVRQNLRLLQSRNPDLKIKGLEEIRNGNIARGE